MQGKLVIGAVLMAALGSASAVASDTVRRQPCQKGEQQQQQQQARQPSQARQPQQRSKPQGCPITRTIPSVVDPTPTFLL